MSGTPPLNPDEHVVFDHVPSLRVFKRTALLMIALTLPAVIAMLVVFPDTLWPTVPLFVTCLILTQERVRLGRYRAWITNQRILLQGDRTIPLAEVQALAKAGNGVRLNIGNGVKGVKLFYPSDPGALIAAIEQARKGAA